MYVREVHGKQLVHQIRGQATERPSPSSRFRRIAITPRRNWGAAGCLTCSLALAEPGLWSTTISLLFQTPPKRAHRLRAGTVKVQLEPRAKHVPQISARPSAGKHFALLLQMHQPSFTESRTVLP